MIIYLNKNERWAELHKTIGLQDLVFCIILINIIDEWYLTTMKGESSDIKPKGLQEIQTLW